MDNCESCKYWLKEPVNPRCRRFPTYTIHGANDWCGEFCGPDAALPQFHKDAFALSYPMPQPGEIVTVSAAKEAVQEEAPLTPYGEEMQAEAERLRAENEAMKAKQPPKRKRK